jgi:hypothetical protein
VSLCDCPLGGEFGSLARIIVVEQELGGFRLAVIVVLMELIHPECGFLPLIGLGSHPSRTVFPASRG